MTSGHAERTFAGGLARRSPDVHAYGARRDGDDRFLAVQVWEWEGDQYDLRLYLTREHANGGCETQVLRSRYYAVTIARLLELMGEAGFVDVTRRDDVLFQPVLIGRVMASHAEEERSYSRESRGRLSVANPARHPEED